MLYRNIEEEINAYLKIMPVVLITGARQSGKTTLVEALIESKKIPLYTFDDEFTLANASRDPSGWLKSLPKPVAIDEVQRVKEIFLPIKQDVDQNREPGRYILTGSANPLLLPNLSDSLAGRMGIINMYPFSQGELSKIKETFTTYIFGDQIDPQDKIGPFSKEDLHSTILKGGFPPVHSFQEPLDVRRWIHSYLQTMMQKDIRDLSNIEGLREFPRLFQLLATRSAQLLNISEMSRSLGMVHATLNRYLHLLETLFFIHLVPAWYSNLGKRITKGPKIHVCDTAIICDLIGLDHKRLIQDPQITGQLLETFVFLELLKQKSWSPFPFNIYHFRDGNYEVDLVLEKPDGTIIGIEIKTAHNLRSDDWKGLNYLKKLAPNQFKRGIVLHSGDQVQRLSDDIWAFPIQSLWHPFQNRSDMHEQD